MQELKHPEDDDDYRLLSPTADDDHPFTLVDDAGVEGPAYHGGLLVPEEALRIQGIPPQEKDAKMDPADHLADQRKTWRILQ